MATLKYAFTSASASVAVAIFLSLYYNQYTCVSLIIGTSGFVASHQKCSISPDAFNDFPLSVFVVVIVVVDLRSFRLSRLRYRSG